MRYFVVVALIVLGVIFLRQKTAENSAPLKTAEAPHAVLTPRPASEHDWAKAAIDRTNEVKQQVKRERASNEVP